MAQISIDLDAGEEVAALVQRSIQDLDGELRLVIGALNSATQSWQGSSRENFLASWEEWLKEHRRTIDNFSQLESGLRHLLIRMREAAERFDSLA